MVWKGKRLTKYGELLDAACAIQTKEEAAEFLQTWRAENEYADPNLGYLLGYLGAEERERLHALFDVSHPVFGRSY